MGIFDGTLILSDMDGTLLNSKAEIPEGNIRALQYYMNNGGKFSFATGRNYEGMKYFCDVLKVNAPGVTSNGAVIFDFTKNEPKKVFPIGEIGEEIALELLKRFDDIGIEVMYAQSIYVLKANIITDQHIEYTKMSAKNATFEELPRPWVHMLITRDPATIAEVYDFIDKNYGEKVFFQYSAPFFLELQAKVSNKGNAALEIAQMLGIEKSGLYTVGDGQNDIQLLQCTQNCFAPGNAHPDVLKVTNNILTDNDNDTLASLVQFIENERKSKI